MTNPPRTKEEAEKLLYGSEIRKITYSPHLCAWSVQDTPWRVWNQCSRNPGHGPDNLYCKQHAKMVEGKP